MLHGLKFILYYFERQTFCRNVSTFKFRFVLSRYMLSRRSYCIVKGMDLGQDVACVAAGC